MTPQKFLTAMAETASRHDFDMHMDLISKDVKVLGVPNFEEITYDDWFNQCKEEFENKLISSVSYSELEIQSGTPEETLFVATETIEATDGKKNNHRIQFLIRKEDDGQWRVVLERILPEEDSGEAEETQTVNVMDLLQ
jgi:ketosteroid isomerase-like protein